MSAIAAIATCVAMLLYPGGTALDHSTVGYRITGNFLSDLGMTVAYDGQPNHTGAALFVASIVLLIAGMGGALVGFVRLYAADHSARRFSWGAAALGLLDCLCFLGVALATEDRAMSAHVAFTLAGFRILPLVVVLLMLAARATGRTAQSVVRAWALLAAVLIAYVVLLQGGAWTGTAAGFAAQVIAQKVVAIVMVSVVSWQCHGAARIIPRPRPVPLQT